VYGSFEKMNLVERQKMIFYLPKKYVNEFQNLMDSLNPVPDGVDEKLSVLV